MKIIIAGGRDFVPSTETDHYLDGLRVAIPITTVICGMARGADLYGKQWAEFWQIPVMCFPADWEKYGRKAGPMRNIEMGNVADGLIAFPGGTGTAHMIAYMTSLNKPIYKLVIKGIIEDVYG